MCCVLCVVCCEAAGQCDASTGLLLSSLRRDAFREFTRCTRLCWWLCCCRCCRREAVRAAAGGRQLRRATAGSLPLQRSPSRLFSFPFTTYSLFSLQSSLHSQPPVPYYYFLKFMILLKLYFNSSFGLYMYFPRYSLKVSLIYNITTWESRSILVFLVNKDPKPIPLNLFEIEFHFY